LSDTQNIPSHSLATKDEVYKLEVKLLKEIGDARLSLLDLKLLITKILMFGLVILSAIASAIYIGHLH